MRLACSHNLRVCMCVCVRVCVRVRFDSFSGFPENADSAQPGKVLFATRWSFWVEACEKDGWAWDYLAACSYESSCKINVCYPVSSFWHKCLWYPQYKCGELAYPLYSYSLLPQIMYSLLQCNLYCCLGLPGPGMSPSSFLKVAMARLTKDLHVMRADNVLCN